MENVGLCTVCSRPTTRTCQNCGRLVCETCIKGHDCTKLKYKPLG